MCMVVGPSALFRPLATFYEPRARLRRAAGTPAARLWRACGALGGLLYRSRACWGMLGDVSPSTPDLTSSEAARRL